MAMRTTLIAALLISTASASWSETAEIRNVVLFESGLAEIERTTGAKTEVTLRVPQRDVNDVLKSLILLGTGITGASILLDGASPVEDAFLDAPIRPDAIGDLEALLRSIPGTRIKITVNDKDFEGAVMGVTRAQVCDEDVRCPVHVALRDDTGKISRIVLSDHVDVAILDDVINSTIERGLDAMQTAAGSGARDITLKIAASDDADGALSYVIAAPAWKTAYRAITDLSGRVDLQAWAVIENATSENWDDVRLTLSSGSPNVLTSDLQSRRWPSRVSYDPAPPAAQKLTATMELMAASDSFSGDAVMERGVMAMAPAPMTAAAKSSEGVADSRFTFPDPVDLPSGKMISVPFLSDPLEARHVTRYRGQLQNRVGYPDLILDLTNTLSVRLPAGIMTVYEAGSGYIGDAAFPLLAPGESALVRFGEDRKVSVNETVTSERRERTVVISRGTLTILDEDVRETSYRISSPAGVTRAVLVEHPVIEGWQARVTVGPSEFTDVMSVDGSFVKQFEINVAPDDEVVLTIEEIRPVQETIAITEFTPETLLSFSSRVMSDDDRVFLIATADLMEKRVRLQRLLDDVGENRARLIQDQHRLTELLTSFPDVSQQAEDYRNNIVRLESEVRSLDEDQKVTRAELSTADIALQAHVTSR